MTSSSIPWFNRIGNALEFIKFAHSIFALPFALVAMWTAGRGHVAWWQFCWIVCCMVTARTVAMSFNRLIDWEIDKGNPRTANRHKLIGKSTGWCILVIAALLFVFCAGQLNRLCLWLSPLALLIVLFYSITKRFTAFPHFFLGLGLGIAPIGAWIAITGNWPPAAPVVLGVAVLCWVFGFDLIYATMDVEFDRREHLYSFPAKYGVAAAMRVAQLLHVVAVVGFFLFGWLADCSWIYYLAAALTSLALVWEHKIADVNDVDSVNKAFFNINAIVSVILLVGTFLDSFLWNR